MPEHPLRQAYAVAVPKRVDDHRDRRQQQGIVALIEGRVHDQRWLILSHVPVPDELQQRGTIRPAGIGNRHERWQVRIPQPQPGRITAPNRIPETERVLSSESSGPYLASGRQC